MLPPRPGKSGALLFLAGIAGGIGITFWMLRAPQPPMPAGAGTPAVPGTAPVALRAHPEEQARDPWSQLSDAISETNRDARKQALRELAARLAAGSIEEALRLAAKIPDASDRVDYLRALFTAWAGRDPIAALTHAKSHLAAGTAQSECIDAAVEQWAGSHPREARQWIEANLGGPLKEEGMAALMTGWARSDPAGAAAWFAATGSTSQSLLNAVVSTWADREPRSAAAWVEGLGDPENKLVGRVILAGEWVRQNAAEAAAYFTPMLTPDRQGLDLGTALVNAWGAEDPAAAARWIESLPQGSLRNEAAGALATIWAGRDIAAAVRWSESLTDADVRAGVIGHLGRTWGAIEPRKALAWIDTLPAGTVREEATVGALDSWAANDTGGLAAWIASQPQGPRADHARHSLGEVQIDRDPRTAMQTALGVSDPVRRQDLAVKLFRHWKRSDATGAGAWLQGAGLPPELRQALDPSR